MNRRQFSKGVIAGGLLLGTGGYAWLQMDPDHSELTIDSALATLDAIAIDGLQIPGPWDNYQVFSHCAQSVEFSMSGFPEHKPDVFKNTVGRLAFSVFSRRGKMSHALDEPIPGAPALPPGEETAQALTRLKIALIEFRDHTGVLQPHFAYGSLSKSEYAVAHVLHLNNHLNGARRATA